MPFGIILSCEMNFQNNIPVSYIQTYNKIVHFIQFWNHEPIVYINNQPFQYYIISYRYYKHGWEDNLKKHGKETKHYICYTISYFSNIESLSSQKSIFISIQDSSKLLNRRMMTLPHTSY